MASNLMLPRCKSPEPHVFLKEHLEHVELACIKHLSKLSSTTSVESAQIGSRLDRGWIEDLADPQIPIHTINTSGDPLKVEKSKVLEESVGPSDLADLSVGA